MNPKNNVREKIMGPLRAAWEAKRAVDQANNPEKHGKTQGKPESELEVLPETPSEKPSEKPSEAQAREAGKLPRKGKR